MAEPSARIARLNALSTEDFVAVVGDLFEGSAWVAAPAAARRPLRDRDELMSALWDSVLAADAVLQDAIIGAHPDLSAKPDRSLALSAQSADEQGSTGLDGCTAAQREALRRLNLAHRTRFGFPFVVAVRGMSVPEILAEMERRIVLDAPRARARALEEVRRIAEGRLDRLLDSL